jgi:BCD family chlorophyll transporter-like MFS transporter
VPINSTLNRVMIKELAISATLVAFLATLPYLFSPIQVAIGSFSDRHPVFGFRRTPYILLGIILTVLGVVISPQVAFLLSTNWSQGVLVGLLAFGAWGMGYNFASVSYLSLASELSGEKGRGRTIAVMWFMMITSIILTSIVLSQLVDPYTPQALRRAFLVIGLAALVLGLLGLLKLERRQQALSEPSSEGQSWGTLLRAVLLNPQATIFFVYLTILLAAILGQDILLEPFGAEAFGLSVKATTRITSLWGVCVLVALLIAGMLENRIGKRRVAQIGGVNALLGFILIATSGYLGSQSVFYTGVVFLGVGTGLSTVSNLSLMLDMTTASNVGLFIGAWGVANAMSRFIGTILGGVVRDVVALTTQSPVGAYVVVFVIEAILLLVSLFMLRWVDVSAFKRNAQEPSLVERAALATET